MRLTDWLERRETRRRRTRRARALAGDQRHRRRLRPVRPDRRADAPGKAHRRHHHRQEAEPDRAIERVRHQGLLWRWRFASIFCAPPARKPRRSSPSATTMRTASCQRSAVKAVLEAFPQASVMVRAFDRRHLIELRGLDLVLAERELFESAVVMGKAALRASGVDSARDRAGRARISDARLRATGAAARDRRYPGRAGRRPSARIAPLPDEDGNSGLGLALQDIDRGRARSLRRRRYARRRRSSHGCAPARRIAAAHRRGVPACPWGRRS